MDLVKEHIAAEDRQDAEAVMTTFTDDCIYNLPTFGLAMRGKEEVYEFYKNMFQQFPDFGHVEEEFFEFETGVMVRVRHVATIIGGWNGIEPPPEKIGTKMYFSALAHFPLAPDGLLLGENVWMDGSEILAGYGVVPSADIFGVAQVLQRPAVHLQ